jgi:hypothetical protein
MLLIRKAVPAEHGQFTTQLSPSIDSPSVEVKLPLLSTFSFYPRVITIRCGSRTAKRLSL